MLLTNRLGALVIASSLVAACGGGGGGGGGPTTPATSSPTPVPTATPTATPSPTPVPTATPTATPSPTPVPTATPTATPSPVTISDGGSTNRRAFTIVVNYNDAATISQNGTTRMGTVSGAATTQLYNDVMANVPLANVATANGCTKSASYGSTTTLSYAGSATQDISCPPSSTSPAQTLYNDVTTIESQLGPFNN